MTDYTIMLQRKQVLQLVLKTCRNNLKLNTEKSLQSVNHGSNRLRIASFTSSAKTWQNQKSGGREVDVEGNPYFEKYKSKILHMQETNPEEYDHRMQSLAERLMSKPTSPGTQTDVKPGNIGQAGPVKACKPTDVATAGVGMTKSEGLDSIIKMDLMKDKSAEEISQLWSEYHSSKDCIYSVLKPEEFENLMEKAKECPVFVYPIPRDDGFEFILAQFDRHDVYFTPLSMFQLVQENAPPCLTLKHYPDLMQEKGIVLMVGQFDDKVLKQELALSLTQQMTIFYGRNSKYYSLVEAFNKRPEEFKYEELIDALKSLPQHDLK